MLLQFIASQRERRLDTGVTQIAVRADLSCNAVFQGVRTGL
jgi:hypothetical protein